MPSFDRITTGRRRRPAIVAAVTAVAALAGFAVATAAPDEAHSSEPFTVVGLTNTQELVAFASDDPAHGAVIGAVSGLNGDSRIVGVDCRVTDSQLTASAIAAASNHQPPRRHRHQGLPTHRRARRPRLRHRLQPSRQPPAHHHRHRPEPAPQPRRPNRHPGDRHHRRRHPAHLPPDTGTARGVTGAAYYNNDVDPATATTLFVIDALSDHVAIQSPANNGVLNATGGLGVDAQGDVGVEIHYDQTGGDTDGIGYATLDVDGTRGLYRIDLLTGQTNLVGSFPAAHQVTDLAAGFRRDEVRGIMLGEPYARYEPINYEYVSI